MSRVVERVEPRAEPLLDVDEIGNHAVQAIVAIDVATANQRVSELGDTEADREHRRVLGMIGAMTTTHHGHVDSDGGDGMISRFGSIANAAAAAMCMVAAAPEVSSPSAGAPLRVRAGVHLGELQVDPEGHPSGPALAVAVRVCDAGAMGRVTLTDHAAAELGDEGWVCLEPLGPAELSGLDQPVGLWQVAAVTPPRPFPTA